MRPSRVSPALLPLLCLLPALVVAMPAVADDPDNCLLCHQYHGLGRLDRDRDQVHLYYVNPDYTDRRMGPHARLACTDCHIREEVAVIPHEPVTPVDCARQCHLSSPNELERRFSHGNVMGMLAISAHPPALLQKLEFSGGPVLNEGQSICLYCHDEPVFRDPFAADPRLQARTERAIDRCDVCHVQQVPLDLHYYLKHIAARYESARTPLGQAQVCAVCHTDPKILDEYDMHNAVASFVRSFHGKAALLGDNTTADCVACHVLRGENAHLMLGKQQSGSSVNAINIADSCRSFECHPGADPQIAEAAVHLDIQQQHGTIEFAIAALFIVLTILTFGPSAVLVLLDLVQVVVGREYHADEETEQLAEKVLKDPRGGSLLTRFTRKQRAEHWVLTVLFVLLVLTGFPMKFADRGWAATLINLFGGLSTARVIHHWSGIALVVGFVLHMFDVLYTFIRRTRMMHPELNGKVLWQSWSRLPMWISWDDVRKTGHLFGYLLFLRKSRPAFGRFSPAEKFEYLGVFWGTCLLGITGLLLWGEQISSHFLSGRAFNIATIAHTYEAFLALIHVGILHIYNVIFSPKVFPLSRATLTGRTPIKKLAEEHAALIREAADELGICGEDGVEHGE